MINNVDLTDMSVVDSELSLTTAKIMSRTKSMAPGQHQPGFKSFSSPDKMDVDIDEVRDRLDMFADTVKKLLKEEDANVFAIQISLYCVEKAKILSLIYQFKQVRAIRKSNEQMQLLDETLKKLNVLRTQAELKIVERDAKKFFKKAWATQVKTYNLKELERESSEANDAFDLISTASKTKNNINFVKWVKVNRALQSKPGLQNKLRLLTSKAG